MRVVTIVALLWLPFAVAGPRWSRLPWKLHSGLYFAALGLGFMCLEISLIQKLTLFLGYPTYTLTVTLFGLLVFHSKRVLETRQFSPRLQ